MSNLNQESSEPCNRFVILRHTFPDQEKGGFFDHFDLMLEQLSKLATWQLKALPELGEAVPAKKLADHRKRYLDYEGPISDGRGSVERVMQGTYFVCHQDDECLEVLLTECLEVLLTQTSQDNSMKLKIVLGSSDEATIFRI